MYIDNILVYSKSTKEHVTHLEFVLQKLKRTSYMLIEWKVNSQVQKWTFWDMCCPKKGWSPTQKKIESIKEWQNLSLAKWVRSFLGLANFYKKFMKDFLALAKLLIDLLKKEGSFGWKGEQQKTFDLFKGKLLSTLMLWLLNFSKPFKVHTDVNGFAIGKVLMKKGTQLPLKIKSWWRRSWDG